MTVRKTMIWLQSGGCGGCTMSLLCAENPGLFDALDQAGIDLLWHPSLSDDETSLPDLLACVVNGQQHLDFLCIEGAVLTGAGGRFHMLAGTQRSFQDWFLTLAPLAGYVVAIGSCSSYAAIAGNNPDTGARGLQFDGDKPGGMLGKTFTSQQDWPVINIAGCPAHPDWVLETLQGISTGMMKPEHLEERQRPALFADQLAHHACPRNEYYEYKASAKELGQNGCLMENLGCKATQTKADCNIRLWNGQGSCLRAGYPCIGCTSPEFDKPGHEFTQTPKVAGIPIGIPTDMPKAWFVALSSLSKAATPERLKMNSVADHIVVSPKTPDKTPPGHKS